MNESAVIAIFLGILVLNPTSESLASNENVTFNKNLEYAYNVTTSIIDDVKESIFTIKLKCRERSSDTVACRLEDPQYQTIFHISPCNKTIDLCNKEHLGADNSYIGRFDIKYNSSSVERLITSPETSLKQLSFYRIVADLIFPGVDVSTQPEGTYSLVEQSVYGKCQALVKVVRSRIKIDVNETRNSGKLVFFPRGTKSRNNDRNSSQHYGEMLSVKRTRNLETCYPVPGLLIFDAFFYHPMMTSVHYDLKSSISRIIVRDRAFTSYTTEEIAMKNIEKPGGNTTMLHVRTTLELHSIDRVEKAIPPIFDSISVDLPFVNGFNPAEKNDSPSSSPNDTSTNIVKKDDSINNKTRNNDSNKTGQ